MVNESKRFKACLTALKQLRQELEEKENNPEAPRLSQMHLRIVSHNNFPTAAGLASSAAGFAALVRAIADLYELPQSPSELSRIARLGSGSACRSLMGGYVAWDKGVEEDGRDSIAQQVATETHWPMKAAILVVSASKKTVSSTDGMQHTVATSELFTRRSRTLVPSRMDKMKKAIQERDWDLFASLTMRDSNNFHAVCLDTYPPIFYLNDTSRAIIQLIHELNRVANKVVAAYTFDAGPNAVIYYLPENEAWIISLLRNCFEEAVGIDHLPELNPAKGESILHPGFNMRFAEAVAGKVSRIILTEVGPGPQKLGTEDSLIDEMGEPKGSEGLTMFHEGHQRLKEPSELELPRTQPHP